MSLNVHHLEVFFHVARHKSITRAAVALGREQPTLSAQVGELEKSLGGVRLFHRRPFQLTNAGKELYEAIHSFFTQLPRVEEKIRGGEILRIGASPIILRDHLPAIEKQVRRRFPKLRLFLREGSGPDLLRDVERDDLDLAITLKPRHALPKVRVEPLSLALPLTLLVPRKHPAKSADDILLAEPMEPLISLPPEEIITQTFAEALRERRISWRPSVEVASLELLQHFVREGYGVGVSVQRPDAKAPPGVRELPMENVPPVELALVHRDRGAMRLFNCFVAEARKHVAQVRGSPKRGATRRG